MNDNEKDGNSYGHVLKYTGIFGGVQGLNILMGLVRNKLVAVILGPAGMGLVSLFNTAANFVSQATNLGLSFSAIRNLSELFDSGDQERIVRFVKTVRAWSLVASLLGILVCIVASPLLNRYMFDGESHTLEIMALAPVVAMTTFAGGETAILKGARRLRELARIQVAMVAALLVISVPLYYLFGVGGIIPVLLLTALANPVCRMAPPTTNKPTIMTTTVDEKPAKASSGVSIPSTISAVSAQRATMSERTLPMTNIITVRASMMSVAVIVFSKLSLSNHS